MVTYNEYIKNILSQISDSYTVLKETQDKPEDLDKIKKELLKINGFLKVIIRKTNTEKIQSSDFRTLESKFQHYLDNYYFEQEIETMATLYSSDVGRIKNMRLKILETLEDRKMMENVAEMIKKL